MTTVTATQFTKWFGRYREEAQHEPIAVTSHGRVTGYYVSAREMDELQRLRKLERRVYHVSEISEDLAEAIKNSRMSSKHDHLNALLDGD